jgi:hypothetical protein
MAELLDHDLQTRRIRRHITFEEDPLLTTRCGLVQPLITNEKDTSQRSHGKLRLSASHLPGREA